MLLITSKVKAKIVNNWIEELTTEQWAELGRRKGFIPSFTVTIDRANSTSAITDVN